MFRSTLKFALVIQYTVVALALPSIGHANQAAQSSITQVNFQAEGDTVNVIKDKASKQKLSEFAPEKIHSESLANLAKAKKHNIMVETAKEFPKESVFFFAAIGLVMASQLYTNYANNPVALEQHIESLKDPVAHLSFYTFMLANRAAMGPLMATMGNKKLLQQAIPYLGMTIGMTASHITAELLYPLKQCVSDLTDSKRDKNKTPTSCSEAYKDFVLTEKITDMVPGLVSMLTSTAVSTLIQQGIISTTKSKSGMAVKLGAKQALKVIGINVVTCFVPGGIFVKGGQVLVKVVQLSGFVALDHLFNPLVTIPYNNFVKGRKLENLSEEITAEIIGNKRNKWNDSTALSVKLEEFQKQTSQWRQLNLTNTLVSHDAWLKEITNVTGNYSAAFQFYSHFLNELAVSKNKDPENTSKLDLIYPLSGVPAAIPEGYSEFPAQAYLSGPQQAERFQMMTIKKAEQLIKSTDTKKASPQEKKSLQILANAFAANDPIVVAKGLQEYQMMIHPMRWNSAYMSESYRRLVLGLKELLGDAQPSLEPGKGYIAAYSLHPTYKETLVLLEDQSNRFRYAVKNPAEHLLMQMVCGPDTSKGEQLIDYSWGFSDKFFAPRIINSKEVVDACQRIIPAVPNHYMYTEKISVLNAANQDKQYRGVIELIKGEVAIGPATISANFQSWWKQNVDPHLSKAFAIYGEEYMKVINDMITAVRKKSFDRTNGGPMANGPLHSIKQEARLYSLILSDLMTDIMLNQSKKNDWNEMTAPMSQGVMLNDYLKSYTDGIPLMILLLHNKATQLANLTSYYAKNSKTEDLKPSGKTFLWQTELDQNFEALFNTFDQVEIRKVPSKIYKSKDTFDFTTQLSFDEIQATQDEINNILINLSAYLGLSKDTPGEIILNESQKKLAQLCIKGLDRLAQEVTQYVNIVKAVSFDDDSKTQGTTKKESLKPCSSQTITGVRKGC